MLPDTQQFDRRNAIVHLLRNGLVRKQGDLVGMLQRDGYAVTQSSRQPGSAGSWRTESGRALCHAPG